mmetsp:Transcript_26510/g.63336  ORF Transcript_26510/g.63336 Transcript_26510/m.63336 type:complete len:242 (-) Transcript_26510:332-1057(-)
MFCTTERSIATSDFLKASVLNIACVAASIPDTGAVWDSMLESIWVPAFLPVDLLPIKSSSFSSLPVSAAAMASWISKLVQLIPREIVGAGVAWASFCLCVTIRVCIALSAYLSWPALALTSSVYLRFSSLIVSSLGSSSATHAEWISRMKTVSVSERMMATSLSRSAAFGGMSFSNVILTRSAGSLSPSPPASSRLPPSSFSCRTGVAFPSLLHPDFDSPAEESASNLSDALTERGDKSSW